MRGRVLSTGISRSARASAAAARSGTRASMRIAFTLVGPRPLSIGPPRPSRARGSAVVAHVVVLDAEVVRDLVDDGPSHLVAQGVLVIAAQLMAAFEDHDVV